jgi:short subunit dehydrogenase-like uncharacterized protein
MSLAILGVTGFRAASCSTRPGRRGLQVRLVGRRGEALEELARAGEEVRVADASDDGSLRAAFAGIDVVASLAGPFFELGLGPVQAAIESGAHYLDTSGEQQWARLVHAEIQAETAVLPAFGFDYVPGDLAARLAAEKVEGPLDELVVAYSVKSVGTSRGTRRSIGRVLGQKQVAWQNGRLVPSSFGATTRTVRFPFGERRWSSGAERAITVPAAHGRPKRCGQYFRAPAIAARTGGLAASRRPGPRRLACRPGRPEPPEPRAASRSSPRPAAPGGRAAPWSRGPTRTGSQPA